MSEKLDVTDERECMRWILAYSAEFTAIFGWIQGRGVEQFIRNNGWGNAEWQTQTILKKLAKSGHIKLDAKHPHRFTILKTNL